MKMLREVIHGGAFPGIALLFTVVFAVKAPILNWETHFRLFSKSIRESA